MEIAYALGHGGLALGWLTALVTMVIGFLAGRKESPRLFEVTLRSSLITAAALTVSTGCLAALFVLHDYSNQYVWRFSNIDMPVIYKITAVWGGMDGSMLLWCMMLSLSAALVSLSAFKQRVAIMPYTVSVLASSILFFTTVTLFLTNPFRYLASPIVPEDGNGLNPLLQNPYMAIHPPMLYMGFTTFAVPFAFCLAALISGNLSNQWLRLVRRWTLIAWAFLTAGIVLGGYWAYIELGWGGFWAWDPVENASFLPWLTGTAFLHSVMVQERKGMLKIWNVTLIITTYFLTVFGTFLTRSGVVQSVHAFAETDVGWVFLTYLGVMLVISAGLIIYRRKILASERSLVSLISREAFFLFNNIVLVSIMFATLWGVMFPVLSEHMFGEKQTILVPYFNAVNVPLFLGLLFLMGVGPLIAWRKANRMHLLKTFLWPFCFALLASIPIVLAGVEGFYPTLSYGLCIFVVGSVFQELHLAARTRKISEGTTYLSSAGLVLSRHRNRYAGYLVHLGVVIMTIGITASMAHKVEKEFSLSPQESFSIGRFTLALGAIRELNTPNYSGLAADIQVSERKSGSKITELSPELRRYIRNGESTSEVAINSSLREDLYLVLAGLDELGQRAVFKVFINPLQVWLWIGTLVVVTGILIIIISDFDESRKVSA